MATTSTSKLIDHCLRAARQIVHECAQIIDDEAHSVSPPHPHVNPQKPPPNPDSRKRSQPCGLEGCEEPFIELLSRQASRILQLYESSSSNVNDTESPKPTQAEEREKATLLMKRRLDLLTKTAYGKFYAYLYKEVPMCWRQLYTDAAILKFAVLVLLEPGFEADEELKEYRHEKATEKDDGRGTEIEKTMKREKVIDEMVKTLDLSLILAGAAGQSRGRRWVDEAFTLLEDVLGDVNATILGAGGPQNEDDGEKKGERPQKKRRLSPSHGTKDEGIEQISDRCQNTPSFSAHEPFTPPIKNPIRRVPADSFSIEEFQSHFTKPRPDGGPGPAPLIITGLVDHWPALTTHPWNKPAYLLTRTLSGRRLVPVEIGRSYVDEGWGQKIISFGEFLSKYIDSSIPFTPAFSDVSPFLSSSSSAQQHHSPPSQVHAKEEAQIAYLAQHPLFLQLPRLRADILIPDLCYTAPPLHPTDPSQDQPEVDSPQLNAWFGPPGTITPLHTDPYHNLLVQVAGRKYVRLYGPEQTSKMRPRGKEGGVEMGNTSGWDLGVEEGWDKPHDGEEDGGEGEGGKDATGGKGNEDQKENEGKAWEEDFIKVQFVDCILEPGDTLYIPIGWWHYVRGLSVSFSVSFWWN